MLNLKLDFTASRFCHKILRKLCFDLYPWFYLISCFREREKSHSQSKTKKCGFALIFEIIIIVRDTEKFIKPRFVIKPSVNLHRY